MSNRVNFFYFYVRWMNQKGKKWQWVQKQSWKKSFCESFGCAVKKIIQYIIDRLNDLPAKYITLLDTLWNSIEGLSAGTWKSIMVEAMKILGHILSLVNFSNCSATLTSLTSSGFFSKDHFCTSDLKVMLKPESTVNESLKHDLSGLAERLKKLQFLLMP